MSVTLVVMVTVIVFRLFDVPNLDVLHVIFTRLCLGLLSVRVGDSSRCNKETVKNLEMRL